MPWTTADGEEERWQWRKNTDGGRRCYHCDSCDAATTQGGEGLVSVKCTAAVRLLLRGLREAQDEAAGGGAVSWAAISAKFRAKGSKLKAMRAALPARWRHWLREWLSEVLAVHTDLVSRRTLGISSAVRSRPYDGFALTAAGHAKLCQLEQLGGAGAGPVWISVPRWLAGSLRGRRDGSVLADCDGGEDETEGGSESEEDETGLPHAGYCHAIQPRPATGAALSRGLPVAVFFAAPHNGWHDGAVAQDSATVGGSVLVRFADGEFRLRLSRTGFGRFAMWVIRDTSREEEWRPDGHELLQRECLVNGRGGTVRMWCAQRGRFAASAHDEKEEFEMSLAETQGAVHLLTERQLHGAPPSAATPERAPSTLTSPSAPPDGTASPAAATPWLLRWELERQRARSGWQPSEESLALLHEAWLRHDAPLPPLDATASAELRYRRSRERAAAVRRAVDQQLVLPFAPAGSVVRYRVRVSSGGALEMLEPRRDGRTLAHGLFGAEAWLHVEFESLPDRAASSQGPAPQAQQQRVLSDGIELCGVRFLFFGFKAGKSMADSKAYFLRESGVLADSAAFEAAAGAARLAGDRPAWTTWRGVREARGLLASFHSMSSIGKLSKRLCLPFSGTQRALDGFRCRVFDWRAGKSRRAAHAAPCLPLRRGSPLLGAAGGAAGLVHIYIVDDIPAARGAMVMTDGAGLIASNLAAMLPNVSEGALLPGDGGGLSPLGCQGRVYAHGTLAKGTLLACRSLPPGVIVLTSSQIKVEASASHGGSSGEALATAESQRLFALELIDQTRKHQPRLNAQLIPILEAASGEDGSEGRERFCAYLIRQAAAEAEQVLQLQRPSSSRGQQLAAALKAVHNKGAAGGHAARFGLGTPSIADMVDAGCSVLHEPYLLEQCQRGIDNALSKLRKGKMRLGHDSVNVMGFPDFTGSLREGEIFLVIDGKHCQPLAVVRGAGSLSAAAGARAGPVPLVSDALVFGSRS